jgi:hypothetical protein
MTLDERIRFWREIEIRIDRALALCAEYVPDGVAQEVEAYLDHNELGLAWETLCGVLIERAVMPDDGIRHLLLEAGEQMGYADPEQPWHDVWRHLNEQDKGN